MSRRGRQGGQTKCILAKLKSQLIEICVYRNLSISVSAWVFPGVSI